MMRGCYSSIKVAPKTNPKLIIHKNYSNPHELTFGNICNII